MMEKEETPPEETSTEAEEKKETFPEPEKAPEAEAPPEPAKEPPRIGVFICHCGPNIGGVVNVPGVCECAETLPGVVTVKDIKQSCYKEGQTIISDEIKKQNLNRVVIAGCTPALYEETFRTVLESAGLNPYLLEIANIREHCSYVHPDPKDATEKAKTLLRMAVARAGLLRPLEIREKGANKAALVIGAGVTGVTSALHLANSGIKTYLLERKPTIGGHLIMLDRTFPNHCNMCFPPEMLAAGRHPNIELLPYSELLEVNGHAGNFNVKVKRKPTYVTEKCTGCGACIENCPVSIEDEFNQGYSKRKAIYFPPSVAIPGVCLIYPENCKNLQGESCEICRKSCEYGAIDFDQQEEIVEINVGSIIVATGFELYDAAREKEYGYGEYPNVITNLDFERIINSTGPTRGELIRWSDNKIPDRIAFIQCIGSRDESSLPYCSRICCMITVKQAIQVREKYPGVEVYVYYSDIRTPGKGFEELYRKARDIGITFIRGKPGELKQTDNDDLLVVSEDQDSGNLLTNHVDMVILAAGMQPSSGTEELAEKLRIHRSPDGFIMGAHPLRPAETNVKGIFLAGCAQFPKDIPDSVAQAGSAAIGVINLMQTLEREPATPAIDEDKCIGCGLCEELCSAGAMAMVNVEGKKRVEVNASCNGCGICGASCPQRAITIEYYTDKQLIKQIDALL